MSASTSIRRHLHARWLYTAVALVLTLGLPPVRHAAADPAAPDTITITRDNAYQFQGFGTSLAWWANVAGGWSDAKRLPIEDALFTMPDGNHSHALGLNVLRYNIGCEPGVGLPAPGRSEPAA